MEESLGDVSDLVPRTFPKDLLTGAKYKVESQSCWYETTCAWARFGQPLCVMCALSGARLGNNPAGLGSPLLPSCLLFLGGAVSAIHDPWMADKLANLEEFFGFGPEDGV